MFPLEIFFFQSAYETQNVKHLTYEKFVYVSAVIQAKRSV